MTQDGSQLHPARLTRLPEAPTEAQRHRRDTRVWIAREGQWRPAVIVDDGTGPAVLVRWRMTDRGGTGVDTVAWADLAEQPRTERDRFVDGTGWPE